MKNLKLEKIWDPVTRVWHWVLALAIVVNWSFGTWMTFDNIEWHFYVGYTVLGLVAFRILWGLVGPRPIRLSALFHTPAATWRYFKRLPRRVPSGTPGHNPIGSLSIIAMLIVIAGQAVSGLFLESEDFFEYAPLNSYVSSETAKIMRWWHGNLADALLVLVVLHVAAVLFYLVWKRENLIKPMFSGWKWVKRDEDDQR